MTGAILTYANLSGAERRAPTWRTPTWRTPTWSMRSRPASYGRVSSGRTPSVPTDTTATPGATPASTTRSEPGSHGDRVNSRTFRSPDPGPTAVPGRGRSAPGAGRVVALGVDGRCGGRGRRQGPDRRQGATSGPWRDGVSPRAACRRAVHQSVVASSASMATAASIRAANRRASSPSAGHDGGAEGDVVRVRRTVPPPLGRMWRVPSRWTGTTGRPVLGQVGGPAPEVLGPSVGGPAALGEDDQVPAVASSSAARSAERRFTLRALDGDGGQSEGPERRPSTGGRRSSRPPPPPRCGGGTAAAGR